MKKLLNVLPVAVGLACSAAHADDERGRQANQQFDVARQLLAKYYDAARKENPKASFTPAAGREFYLKKVAKGTQDYSCSSCHTDDPTNPGKHAMSGKPIKPLAIHANPESFSSVERAEKNFTKHCRDLYGKDCSAQDKGNYLTYLLSVVKQ